MTKLSMVPLTVQMAGVVEASATGRPADEVATKAAGATPMTWLAGAVKLMVCASICDATVKVCSICGAAV